VDAFLRTSLGSTYADLSARVIELATVAYLDSIARSPRYTTWLAGNPQYGISSGAN
jgi:hypothetical protein